MAILALAAILLVSTILLLLHQAHNFFHVTNLNENILGLDISVDDSTLAVKVVETEQNLL